MRSQNAQPPTQRSLAPSALAAIFLMAALQGEAATFNPSSDSHNAIVQRKVCHRLSEDHRARPSPPVSARSLG
jgi:hypothetical protein